MIRKYQAFVSIIGLTVGVLYIMLNGFLVPNTHWSNLIEYDDLNAITTKLKFNDKNKEKSSSNYNIPFTLYQSWTTSIVPKYRAAQILTFLQNNPHWRYELFSDDNKNYQQTMDGWVHTITNAQKLPNFSKKDHDMIDCVYSLLQNGASKTDLWRYLIIYLNGGMYIDFDAELTNAHMDTLFNKDDKFVTGITFHTIPQHPPGGEYHQWIIVSQPRHPFLYQMINTTCHTVIKYASIISQNINSQWLPTWPSHNFDFKCQSNIHKYIKGEKNEQNSYTGIEWRDIFKQNCAYPAYRCQIGNVIECITGPGVFKYVIDNMLFRQLSDKQLQQMDGFRIYTHYGLNGNFQSKSRNTYSKVLSFVERNVAGVKHWRHATGADFVNLTNQCWKKYV